MASVGIDLGGNQIFVSLRKGSHLTNPFPTTVEVRCKYEQTLLDIKKAVAKKTGCPPEKQQLFWQGKELRAEDDKKTLLEMNLHTGFSLSGYDLTETPDYWPPVEQTPEGLRVVPQEQW